MSLRGIISSLLVVFAAASTTVFGQADAMKPVTIFGDVKAVESEKLVLETQKGALTVSVASSTSYKKVPASNPVPAAATPSSFAEIVVGDKVVVTALPLPDGKYQPARTVLILSKADLAAKERARTEAWRTRSIAGMVEAVNPEVNQITVKITGPMGTSSNIVVSPKADTKFLKYSAESNKYSDAKVSSLDQISKGDSLRALGERSPDGASFTAEEVLTGSFQQVVGTIKSIDADKNEVVVAELASKKEVTISLAAATVMKKFPAEMAQRMAGGGRGGPPGAGLSGPPAGGNAQPAGQPGGLRPNGPGGRGLEDMLERMPNVTTAELKAGEMIAVLAPKSDLTGKVKAFKMFANVEPFVQMAQMAAAAQGGQRGSTPVGLQIPGLDGFSLP